MAIESFPNMTVPLRVEPNGAVRVSGPQTRVNFEFVVWGYKAGETPEETQYRLPTIELADIYAVIAYYLCNKEEVEAYLQKIEEDWEQSDAELDARYPDRHEHMARIRARYPAMQQGTIAQSVRAGDS